MGFRKDYVSEMTSTILRIHPEYNEDRVREIVVRTVKERMKDPTIVLDNNVVLARQKTTLSELCNWIENKNPVISGNATFYVQPTVLRSPASSMLKTLKKERKAVKNEMFALEPTSYEYRMKDLDQQNIKVIMNAEYGGSGAPTAAFYNKYSPPATTLMAQSIITTMAALFEGFVGDNQKFWNITECVDWMNTVITKIDKDEKIPKWMNRPTWQQTAQRIKREFITSDVEGFKYIDKYLQNRSQEEIIYLYYANNMNQFISDNIPVQKIIEKVLDKLPRLIVGEKEIPAGYENKFESVSDYNKWMSEEMFLNPYKIPEVIKDEMDEFIKLATQFIYVEYIPADTIEKLNNHGRNTVVLVDTDSNIINVDLFISHILTNIFPNLQFGREAIYNEMILCNVMCATLSVPVAKLLDFYGRCHHMNEEARSELTMKNEFMFRRLFLMTVKKRYAASIVLREGNIMIPNKIEIKGMDFIKAGVTDEVSETFTNFLKNYILCVDEIDLHGLNRELKRLEMEIYQDLSRGGTKYLKPQQFKAEGAYKAIKDANGNVIGTKAWSIQVFRGAMVWNELYPDKKIYSLDRVKLVKLIVNSIDDLDVIKDSFPDEYNMVVKRIFNSSNENIARSGLKVISIPMNMQELPAWLLPLIDRDIIVSDVISSFRSVLDALKYENISFKTQGGGKASLVSGLISL